MLLRRPDSPKTPWRRPEGPPVAIAFVDGQNLFKSARQVFGHKTDWVRIDRETYDSCLDPRDYFPPRREAASRR